MIEQKAKVVSFDDETVWLEAERQSTCSGCQVRQGCGTGMLAKHVGQKFSRITVKKTSDVEIGQQVQLAIPEETLLQGAALMYLLPLVLMFIFAAIAQSLNFNEALEIIAGISGLFIGFYWVRIRLRNKKDGFQAKIVEE
ncbi:MAG: SoxR reducing system RseC family protein [Piscirickettsiaceae bacterium]|nr:SoxR reducing system RseC family protein [Piscirickettsiaceae bacterium]